MGLKRPSREKDSERMVVESRRREVISLIEFRIHFWQASAERTRPIFVQNYISNPYKNNSPFMVALVEPANVTRPSFSKY